MAYYSGNVFTLDWILLIFLRWTAQLYWPAQLDTGEYLNSLWPWLEGSQEGPGKVLTNVFKLAVWGGEPGASCVVNVECLMLGWERHLLAELTETSWRQSPDTPRQTSIITIPQWRIQGRLHRINDGANAPWKK